MSAREEDRHGIGWTAALGRRSLRYRTGEETEFGQIEAIRFMEPTVLAGILTRADSHIRNGRMTQFKGPRAIALIEQFRRTS